MTRLAVCLTVLAACLHSKAKEGASMLGRFQLMPLVIVAALAAGMTACTRPPRGPGVLNIGNGGEPKDLDPHLVTGIPEWHILLNLFEGLVAKDPKTLEPVPGVAES